MKIILENFGIIKKFEFETDDNFTFIIGKNNTGKSYAMTAVYLIIKNLHYLRNDIILSELDNVTLNTQLTTEEYLQNNSSFIKNLNKSFENSFESINNLENKLNNNKLKIEVNLNSLKFVIKNRSDELYFSYIIEYNKQSIFVEYSDERTQNIEKELLALSSIYYLPASRSGLYQAMSSFGQVFAELSQKRKDITTSITIPTMSEPVSDYYINLVTLKEESSTISRRGLSSSEHKKLEDMIKKNKKDIDKITLEIEENILKGKVYFNKDSKKLTFSPNNTELNLDLSFTSSMVSEISPIVAHLKYIIKKESLPTIMIEEPEAHLHPEVQIQLLKQFVELSKLDIRFIVTTHSNYMFNQLNNLILSKDLNINNTSCLLFKETDEGTESINLEIDEYGIEDENFVYTSEEIYNEKLDIIDKMNEAEND